MPACAADAQSTKCHSWARPEAFGDINARSDAARKGRSGGGEVTGEANSHSRASFPECRSIPSPHRFSRRQRKAAGSRPHKTCSTGSAPNQQVATHSVSPPKRTLHAAIPAPVAPRQRVSHESRQTCRCVSGEVAATTRRTSSLAWLARRLLGCSARRTQLRRVTARPTRHRGPSARCEPFKRSRRHGASHVDLGCPSPPPPSVAS